MGPTWGPSEADRTQVGPMLAPWTLLSGTRYKSSRAFLVNLLSDGCFKTPFVISQHWFLGNGLGPSGLKSLPALMLTQSSVTIYNVTLYDDFRQHEWLSNSLLKLTPHLPITGPSVCACVCVCNSPVTGGFPRSEWAHVVVYVRFWHFQ